MNCELFAEKLDNYESLSSEEKIELAEHAAKCESCAKELDFFMNIMETAKSLPKIEPPKNFINDLNVRIDKEERKQRILQKILHNIKSYKYQYVAAAACLVLVAVVTSNSGDFINPQKDNNDSGVISEQRVDDNGVSDGNNVYDNVIAPVTDENNNSQIPVETGIENKTEKTEAIPQNTSKPAANSTTKIQSEVTQSTVFEKQTTKHSDTAGEVSEKSVTNSEETKAQEMSNVAAQNSESEASENVSEQSEASTDIDTYSVDETNIAAVDSRMVMSEPVENEESDFATEDYSIVSEGEIANARHISGGNGKKQNAIGKLNVSADDIDRAMDIILLYSKNVNGDLYSADATFVSMMLANFNYEGINYSNYIPTYEGQITFELVVS